MRIKSTIFLAVFFLFTFSIHSQIKVVNYLGQNKVQCITEDDNNVWIGTTGGIVVRHKGTGAVVANYTMENGLPGNSVYKIIIDNKGTAWCLIEFVGLVKIDGSSISVSHPDKMNNFDTYADLLVDYSGNKWILSPWQLVQFDDTKWDEYAVGASVKAIMTLDNENNIWISDYYATIHRFNIKTKAITKIADATSEPKLNGKEILSLKTDPNTGIIYFGAVDAMISYDHGTWSKDATITNQVRDISFDISGNQWLATDLGLVKINGGVYKTYVKPFDGLVDNYVNCIFVDSKGIKWAGTNGGASRYDSDLNNWISFILPDPIHSYVYNLVVDKNDQVWTNSTDGLVNYDGTTWSRKGNGILYPFKVDASNNIWYHVNYSNIGYYDHSTFNFVTNVAAGLKIASLNNADKLVYVDNTSKFYIPSIPATYTNAWLSTARYIFQDKQGRYWFGTDNGALCLNGGTWKQYTLPSSERATSIAQDSKGRIWVSTDYSVDTLNTGTDAFVFAFSVLSSTEDMKFDALGNLWMAAMYDLHKCDNNQTIVYDKHKGLALQYGHCIAIDSKGNKWIGSNTGVTKVSCEAPEPQFTADTICYLKNNKTSLTNTTKHEDSFTTYKWDVNNDLANEYTTKDIQHAFPGYGTYPVKMTATNDQCSANITNNVKVSLQPDVALISANPTICKGKLLTMHAIVKNEGNIKGFEYKWNGPISALSDSVVTTGTAGLYSVSVNFENCLSAATAPLKVVVREPYDSSQICMVTVDPTTGKNKIIWARHSGKRIVSYNIYKVFGKSYYPVANVPYDSLSVFNDITSTPESYVARYAISVLDSCGNESSKSPFHQTMLLQASKGTDDTKANLFWAKYIDESGLFVPDFYYIYKGKAKDNMALIDSVSGILEPLYTDTKFDGISAYYQISIKKDDICVPLNFLKAESGPYSQSLSNIAEYKTAAAGMEETSLQISAFPNPFSNEMTLTFSLDEPSDALIEIINAVGEKAGEISLKNQSGSVTQKIYADEFNLSEGIYFIRISASGSSKILKTVLIK